MAIPNTVQERHAGAITAAQEGLLRFKAKFDGTLEKVSVDTTTATSAGACTFTIYVNGVSQGTLELPADAQTAATTGLSVAVSDSDEIRVDLTTIPGGASIGGEYLFVSAEVSDPRDVGGAASNAYEISDGFSNVGFTSLSNVTVDGSNKLVAGTVTPYTGRAASTNTFAPGVVAEIRTVIEEINKDRMFGLQYTDEAQATDYNNLRYCLQFYSDGDVYGYYMGTPLGGGGAPIGTQVADDVWSFAIAADGEVTVLQNGIVMGTFTQLIPDTKTVEINALFGDTGATLKGMQTSGEGVPIDLLVPATTGEPSFTPAPVNLDSFVPTAIDKDTGEVWLYINGAWTLLPTGSGGGGSGSLPTTHISGLEVVWTAVNGFSVTAGEAWVPGANKLVTLASTYSNSGSFSNGKYYLYLFDGDGNGNGDIEMSATAPVSYNGGAQHKTGDDTRRFVGYLLVYGSEIVRFYSQANGNLATIDWQRAYYNAPLNLTFYLNPSDFGKVSDNTDGGASLDVSTIAIPSMCRMQLQVRKFAPAGNRFFYSIGHYMDVQSQQGYWSAEFLDVADNVSGGSTKDTVADKEIKTPNNTTAIKYAVHQNAGSGGQIIIYARGITYRR